MPEAKGVHLGDGSWDVTGVVTTDPPKPYFCDRLDFALTVKDGKMIVGRDGQQSSAPVQVVDGSYVAKAVSMPNAGCKTFSLMADEVRLRGVDTDGDGEADQLEGSASFEKVAIISGDTYDNVKASVALTAVPDHSPPTLLGINFFATPWNPLDQAFVLASEPLRAETKLTLTGTSDVPLPGRGAGEAGEPNSLIHFSSPILPFGGTWHLVGEGMDLAGNALTQEGVIGGTFGTLADPGVQAQDGFESEPSLPSGGASLVTGYGAIPAISGGHSLWIPADKTVVIHLRRSANQNHVSFVARAFSPATGSAFFARDVRVGVVGGNQVIGLPSSSVLATTESASGDEALPWVGESVQLDAELEEPGNDVVLSFEGPACRVDVFTVFGSTVCSKDGWLIDDLKIE